LLFTDFSHSVIRAGANPIGQQAETAAHQHHIAADENNKGTLIMDAACVSQDTRFPTDVSL
jgi:hypothetical protein